MFRDGQSIAQRIEVMKSFIEHEAKEQIREINNSLKQDSTAEESRIFFEGKTTLEDEYKQKKQAFITQQKM